MVLRHADRAQRRPPASLRRLLLLRWLPTCVVALLPGVGEWMWLVDPLFVFGRSRQCLHDLVADTIVVRTRPAPEGQDGAERGTT